MCEECEEKAAEAPPTIDDRVGALEIRLRRVETALAGWRDYAYKIAVRIRNGALIALWAVFCVVVWLL